jgi:hypothetical protein
VKAIYGSIPAGTTSAPKTRVHSSLSGRRDARRAASRSCSCTRLEEFASKSGAVNLSLICSALLTLIVSRKLHQAVLATCRQRAVPHDRWSLLFSSIAHDPLRICSRKNVSALARDLWFYLKTEAPDPNRNRALLAERSSEHKKSNRFSPPEKST